MRVFFKISWLLVTLLTGQISRANKIENGEKKILSPQEIQALGLQALILPNGEVFLPRHDGIRHFIQSADSAKGGIPPTRYAIDEAVARATIFDVTSFERPQLTASQLSNLPITLRFSKASDIQGQKAHYDVTILAMVYKPDGVYFDLGCKFTVPDQLADNLKIIYFGASHFSMPFKGAALSGRLQLIEAPNFSFKNWEFSLGPKTEFAFDCGKFTSFTLDMLVGVDRSLIVPEDRQGKPFGGANTKFTLNGVVKVEGWNDIIVELTTPNNIGFHPADMPEVGFWFGDSRSTGVSKIFVDLSSSKNPIGIPSGNCFTNPEWKGIYIQNMAMRLPSFIKQRRSSGSMVRVSVKDLVLGNHGFYGTASYEDPQGIVKLGDGQLGDGWDISLNKISFGKTCGTGGYNFSFEGALRPPIIEATEAFTYTASYTNSTYIFNIVPPISLSMGVFKGRASISAPTIDLKVRDGVVTGGIQLSGCLQILEASDKLTLGLTFQNLGLTPQKPFIKAPTGIAVTDDCAKGSNQSGFGFQIAGFGLRVTTGPPSQIANEQGTIELPIGVSVNFEGTRKGSKIDSSGKDSFFAKGNFLLKGKLVEEGNRFYMRNTYIGVSDVAVGADFKVFKLAGSVSSFKDDPRYGQGFRGAATFTLGLGKESAASLSGAVDLLFGSKDDYKYWFVDVGLAVSPAAPIVPPIELRGMLGGAYKNMAMAADPSQPSGFAYAPQKGAWGLRAGLMLGIMSGKVPAQINGMIEVVGDNSKGYNRISTVFLIADVNVDVDANGDAQATKNPLANFKQSIQQAYAQYMAYKDKFGATPSEEMTTADQSAAPNYESNVKNTSAAFAPSTALPNRIGAGVIIWYSVDQKTLNGVIYPSINVSAGGIASAKSKGYGLIHFSPSKWYIHLGKSAWDDRLGLMFNAPGIEAEVNAYFMIGHGISTIPTPRVPEEMQSLFASNRSAALNNDPTVKANEAKYADLQEGKGIALGMAMKVSISVGIPVVAKITANAGAGFDMVLAQGIKLCANDGPNSGINGWRGAAQLYGYAMIDLIILRAKIASLGLGLALKMAAPNPIYADGRVKFYVKIWRSKLDLNARVTIGSPCDEVTPPAELVKFEAVKSTYPTEAPTLTNVPVATKIKIFFNDLGEYTSTTGSEEYKPKIENFELKTAAGTPVAGALGEMYKNENNEWVADFTPAQILTKSTQFTTNFNAYLVDKNGTKATNETTNTVLKQAKSFAFTTGSLLRLSDVAVQAVPLKNQYNVYWGDEIPFLKIDPKIVPLLQESCPACRFEARIVRKETGEITWKQSLSDIAQSLPLSEASLASNCIYELQLWANPEGVMQAIYDKHFFRTSQYASFEAKIIDINKQKKVQALVDGYPYFLVSDMQSNFEGFSTYELTRQIKMKAANSDWFDAYNRNYGAANDDYWKSTRLEKIIGYQQSFTVDMKEGVIVKKATGTNTAPQWEYRPFDESLVAYQNRQSICQMEGIDNTGRTAERSPTSNTCPDISDFAAGSYGITLAYNSASNLQKEGLITFENENNIELTNIRYAKRLLQLTCTPNAIDSRLIKFDWKSLKSTDENVAFPIETDMSLKLSMGKTVELTTTRQLAQDSTRGSFSAFASKVGCPSKNQVSLTGGKSFRYDINILVAPTTPANFKPTMVSFCEPNNVFDGDGFVESGKNIVFTFYESSTLQERQALRSPLVITLSSGQSLTLPAGSSQYTFPIDADDNCPTLTSIPDNAVTIGDPALLNAPNHLYGFAVSVARSAQVDACELNTYTETIYSPVNALAKGGSVSTTQGKTKLKPEDGFYKRLLTDKTEAWVQVVAGNIADMGTCGVAPTPCNGTVAAPTIRILSNARIDFGALVSFEASGCSGTVRWIDEDKTGASVSFTPAVSKRYTAYCDVAGCQASPPSNSIEVTVVGALTLSTDAPNNTLCATSALNLMATGCSGTMTWKANGQTWTGSRASVNLTQTTTFETECSVGNRSLKGANLTVKVLPLPDAPQIDALPQGYICLGGSATLTATGCNEYRWLDNQQSTASIVVSPTSPQSYGLQCVSVAGCLSVVSTSQTLEVIRLSTPTVSTTAYQQKICVNTPAVLQVQSCDKTITWSNGQTGSQISVSPISTTTYSAVCQDRGCPSAASNSLTITVLNSLPTPSLTADKNDICANQNATLQVGGTCEGVWEWSTGASVVTTITANQTANYQVRCNLNNNCFSQWASQTVTLRPTPAAPQIGSDKPAHTICQNEIITLNASSEAGNTLIWRQFNNQNATNTTTPPAGSHTYQVISRSPYGCESPDASLTATVKALPAAPLFSFGGNPICDYQQTNLTASTCTGGRMHWSHDPNLTSSVIVNASTATYQARCEVNGCFGPSATAPTLVITSRPTPPSLSGGGDVCEGDTRTLTATGGGQVFWSNSAQGGVIQAPAGSYTAYQIQNGCQSLDAAAVVVNNKPRPAVPTELSADKNPVCYDQTIA
ncbi:MAG: hypothetical protein EAZ50_04530, partial [Runella slithyformis]